MLLSLASEKRLVLLTDIVQHDVPDISMRMLIIDLYIPERHNAYSHFYTSFKYIIIALELIALGLH